MDVMFFLLAIIALLLILLLYRNGRNRYNEYDMYDRDFDQLPYTQYTHQIPPQAPFPWNWWMGQMPPQMPMLPQHNPNFEVYKEHRRERNATDRMLGIVLGVVFGIGMLAIFFKSQFQYTNTPAQPVVHKDTVWIGQKDANQAEIEEPAAKVAGRSISEISPQADPNDPYSLPKYIIKLGTFKNIENVARLKEDFNHRFPYLEITVEQIETTTGWGQRVYIGTFASEREATNFKNRWARGEDWMVLEAL